MKPIHGVFALAIVGTAIPSVSNLGNFASKVTTARAEASRIGDDMTDDDILVNATERESFFKRL